MLEGLTPAGLRGRARDAILCAGGRGFVRFGPANGPLLLTDALLRADAQTADAIRAALVQSGFVAADCPSLLGITPGDALLERLGADAPLAAVRWDAPDASALALARRWQQAPSLPLTPAGRALVLETARLLGQPGAKIDLNPLRARAAAMLRCGDRSGWRIAGNMLCAAFRNNDSDKERGLP